MITIQDVISVANRQLFLTEQIEAIESVLAMYKTELQKHNSEIVPNMMIELGIEELTLRDGYKISIKDEVYAKLPEDSAPAFSWLRTHNLDSVIKNQVSVDFGKGEDEQAQKVLEALMEMGVYPVFKSTIHPQTLKALLREQIAKGSGIPLDEFGATVVKTTVIRKPKSSN